MPDLACGFFERFRLQAQSTDPFERFPDTSSTIVALHRRALGICMAVVVVVVAVPAAAAARAGARALAVAL